jgi:TRAP-type C4-dicarboxylate transport system substrate-binding protein
MRKLQKFTFPVLIGISLLILAACGGDDESVTTTSSSSGSGSTTAAATAVPTAVSSGSSSSGAMSTDESFEFQYVCVNRTLLPCQVVQEYMAAVNERSNGQIEIQLSSYPELGISGFDMIRLLEDGTIGLGEIYSGFVGGEFPIFEAANLWGVYNTVDQWFEASEALEDSIKELVSRETGGGKIVGFNYYSSNYFFTKGPLNTLPDFEGVKTRTHSVVLSDLIGPDGLGASPQTMAFADVYPALERGVLDGAVTCGSCGNGQKWFEVTDYLTGPVPGTFAQTFITFNGKEWNSLPADFQDILLEEGVLHSARAKQAALNSDAESEGDLVGLGMTHSNFTDEMLGIIKDAAKASVIPKWAERAGGFGSESVNLYNEKVGPITGLYVQPDGTAGSTVQ